MCFLQEVNDLLFGERDVATNKRSQKPNGTDRVPPMGTRGMTNFQKISILSPSIRQGCILKTSRTHSSLYSFVNDTSALDTHFPGPIFDILLRVDIDVD